jgi:hypothetical protein
MECGRTYSWYALSLAAFQLQTSLVALIVLMCIGLIIFASGFGFPVLVRSLATAAATTHGFTVSVLYSGLAYSETVGSSLGTTVVTAAFTSTISYGGAAGGTPSITCVVRLVLDAVRSLKLINHTKCSMQQLQCQLLP